MMKTDKPDFTITIGIKDNEIVSISWLEMLQFEGFKSKISVSKRVINYLKSAIKIMKENK